jgi:hypothetical protein
MTLDKPQALVLFELVRSKLTGKTPEIGKVKSIPLRGRRARPAAKRRMAGRARARTRRNP